MLRLKSFALAVIAVAPVLAQPQPRRLEPIRVEKKLALVIGNAVYQRGALKNPINDAMSMADSLRRIGFQVQVERNLTKRDMERAIDQFTAALQRNDFGLFYYSGHGQQIQQENYLLPVDFTASSEADVPYAAYSASRVRDKMESSGARLRVLILDACRDNPWRSTRNSAGGLAPMGTAEGTLIAYATGDHRVADDNVNENNGLFTKHLITALDEPGIGLVDVFRHVKKEVYAASSGRQNPAVYDNVVGDYVVNDPELQRRRLQEDVARLEGELKAIEKRTQEAESEQKRREAEARLEAARREQERLRQEGERRKFLDAERTRLEAERKAEETRVAELRRKVDERRRLPGPAAVAMTLEEARQQAETPEAEDYRG